MLRCASGGKVASEKPGDRAQELGKLLQEVFVDLVKVPEKDKVEVEVCFNAEMEKAGLHLWFPEEVSHHFDFMFAAFMVDFLCR